MLTSHPRLHIPDETHFIADLVRPHAPSDPEAIVAAIVAHQRFWALGLSEEECGRVVRDAGATDLASVLDALYSRSAAARGKDRWGDKTPGYLAHMEALAGLFPAARFVHVIRDGRESSASIAEQSWGPPTTVSAAFWWRRKVRRGRRAGRRLGPQRYLEVRLDELVEGPEHVLTRICQFIGEEFDARMLDYEGSARAFIAARTTPARDHPLLLPPTPGLRTAERLGPHPAEVNAVCHRTLRRLGYPSPRPTVSAILRAYWIRARDVPSAVRVAVRRRAEVGNRLA